MNAWIDRYGIWAVLVGTMLEGETAMILAGYAVSQGYLHALPIWLAGAIGGTVADNLYYTLGCWFGPGLIGRFRGLRRLRARAVLFLRRRGRATAFLVRFAYGMRIALPMTMGAARFRWPVFVLFNGLGAVLFSALYLVLGYLFGATLESLLGRLRGYEVWIVLGVLGLAVIVWGVREWRLRRAEALPAGGGRRKRGGRR